MLCVTFHDKSFSTPCFLDWPLSALCKRIYYCSAHRYGTKGSADSAIHARCSFGLGHL